MEIIKSGSCGNHVAYELNADGVLTISGTGKMQDYSDKKTPPWYNERRQILRVCINSGVTYIGECSFASINPDYAIISVTIPNSVSRIGAGAFASCACLSSVTLPYGMACIEDSTFFNCKSLEHIDIPNSVILINQFACRDCKSLTSIYIPDSVRRIIPTAFDYCDNLVCADVPAHLDVRYVFKEDIVKRRPPLE